MAEPFVFHYRRGPDGTPEQMYLADIQAECPLCRHPQVQRFYHATPLHSVTTGRLAKLAEAVSAKTDYECPNCGDPVGREGAVSTAFTWAFGDDAGLIRAFLRDVESGTFRWQLVPGRRLDPQELPGWEPEEHPDHPIADELDDAWIGDQLDRPVNPKIAIIDALDARLADSSAPTTTRIAPGFWVASTDAPEPSDELELTAVSLTHSVPTELATHRAPQRMAGALRTWLPTRLKGIAERTTLYAAPELVRQNLHRAFDVANLTWEERDDAFCDITTPRDEAYPRNLTMLSVLRRAVYTGLTPGDAARLTAEEIVGMLLRVW